MAAVLILLIGVFCLAFLPQMWVKGILKRHGDERPDIEGTGGEFARHLLDRMGLEGVASRRRSWAITTIPRRRSCA